ncbi:MAG: Smr/MutS family protein [Bacilli bacterium]|nr:Smr/MutS family protein [Bacilli bacterium]
MQNIYETFEFNKIKEAILDFNRTELGKVFVEELAMLPTEKDVRDALLDLDEIMSIITRYGPLPISNSANALKLIEIAKKTALLTPRDLSLVAEDVLTAGKLGVFLNKLDSSYVRSKAYVEKFYDLSNLEREIHRVITNALTVADNASAKLKEIRSRLKVAERTLEQRVASLAITYGSYLTGDDATIRDGHFVLPVATVNKSKVTGIVYDVSDSGATTFIEPLEIVNINNEITALKVEENDEVRRILRELTSLCLLQEREIVINNKIISHFDFVSAKALYANKINAVIANISSSPLLDLIKARHPLIDERKVVSNSYHIDEQKRIIIISGPNAGGKTVSLKTVGLLALMNQCGLAVPAEKATLGYFKNIMIDIGDNQSLSDNLSTFSAHISQIAEITNLVGGKDLILFDELGTGTDPKEGEGLAISVAKYLENKHCFAMISSHFDALKEYAFLSDSIDNASMEFDEEHLLPTYHFRQSTPGHSYAMYVAKKYGINKSIIDEAEKYISSKDLNGTGELLETLQKQLDTANKTLDASIKEKELIDRKLKKIENDERLLEERKMNLLKDVKDEKAKMIEKAEEEIEYIMSQLNNGNIKLHEVIELKKKLTDLRETEATETFDEAIKVGDYVLMPSLNVSGKVTRVQGNKAHLNTSDGMSIDVPLNKITRVQAPKSHMKVHKTNYDARIGEGVGLELNIIGLYVDEAMYEVQKYIDGCRVRRHKQVRIIHGYGSGALRKAVHSYLDKQKDVTYRLGDASEGASGATVVIFK